MASRDNRIVQFRIDLLGFKPPIWRRVQVPASFKLDRLHATIQALFDWDGDHLYQFEVGNALFGPPDFDPGFGARMRPDNGISLSALLKQKVQRFTYVYDFGDHWEHQIKVEKLLDPAPGVAYPVLTGGRCMAPLEDCGGPGGFVGLLQAHRDPEHPDHEMAVEWLGDEPLDPENMDRDAIERRLQALR